MRDMNTVAVLLSTYFGEAYLAEFLESLCCQKKTDFTLYIRDDGSTDDTISIIRGYSSRLKIVLIEGDCRLGPAKSFMRLLDSVPDFYLYYFFADQDDYWCSSKIERAVDKLFYHDKTPSLYCSILEVVDSNLNHISYSERPKNINFENALVENVVTGCTIAINSKARKLLVERFPNNIIMHDWWMYMVISAFGVIIYDDNSYIKYRQHSGNVVGFDFAVFQRILTRSVRFIKSIKSNNQQISIQIRELKTIFSDRFTGEQYKIVNRLLSGKHSIFQRILLVFSKEIYRHGFVSNFVLKIRFLLNKY